MRIQRLALHALVFSVGFLFSATPALRAATPSAVISGGLTLDEAINLAAKNRPELKALRADLNVAEITLNNATLPPNPELGVEWDNLGGNLPIDDTRETTISLSQPIEIRSKPTARKKRSQADSLRIQQMQTTVWHDIAAEVKTAFLEVVGAREKLLLHYEAEQIASELANITHERVAAGELAVTEEIRAEARKAEVIVDSQKIKRNLTEAELDLATVLMDNEAKVAASEKLSQEITIPDRLTLLDEINNSPLLAFYRSEIELAAADLSLEQVNSWSDPTLSLAIREIPDQDARAVSVGVSIPLPLFQRNQSAIAAAHATAQKASANQDKAAHQLEMELIKAHTILLAADQEARTLRNEVLTRATEAAQAVREGFQYGKFRYSDVLESSQNLIEVKSRHLDSILELNRSAITLDRLLGKSPLPEISQIRPSASLDRSTP